MRHFWRIALLLFAALTVGACRLPQTLIAELPESASTVTVWTWLEQPFYSKADGLSAIQLKLNLPAGFAADERPSLGGGAVLKVFYASDQDPRYPDRDFYAWPANQDWIGELLPGRVVAVSFLSRYPYLDGITVRVGTYGAEVGQGIGRLREDVSAIVREAPITGLEIAALPGGGAVEVLGSREGWIRVRLPDGRVGYIDRTLFVELPPAARTNKGELRLRLYREGESMVLREVRLPVQELSDESHVTFSFDPIPDSYQVHYRFEIEAIGSSHGHAVTLWGDPTSGEILFRAHYATVLLAEVGLDAGRWSGVDGTLEVRFPPIRPTRDTYLRFVLEARERPLVVHWSNVRPPGGLPLVTPDNPGVWGGIVFQARFLEELALRTVVKQAIARAGQLIWRDWLLMSWYVVILSSTVLTLAWGLVRGGR